MPSLTHSGGYMRFDEIECSEAVIEKLWIKHAVELCEVNEVLQGEPYVRRAVDGLYYVLGQTDAGRYLFVVLRDLGGGAGRLVTARDATVAERRLYGRR